VTDTTASTSAVSQSRLALTLAYDGTAFEGWQTQTSGGAVQDTLERALSQMADESISTICAGRTDAGVHALGQVVHFDTAAIRPLQAWVRGVNALLPSSVAVQDARVVRSDFHARFSAIRRQYRYLLHVSPVRHPLLAQRVGWSFRELDVARMQQAAQCLIGEHDFSAFRSAQCQASSPVRRLERIAFRRDGPLISLDFVGNAFLHHMIRNLVGMLVMIGDGRKPAQWAGELLSGRDRRAAPATFCAQGLYLVGAEYPDHYGLPPISGSPLDWLCAPRPALSPTSDLSF
jgi:tRNA pseudouridine38-40 synthase